jgi:NAD(P)-dependent dehydrogenase (short-subunit alcohol dehydrogenase family)
MDLRGRVAVVTGAGSGVGRVVARALAARAAHVLVVDVDGDLADEAAHEITSDQGGAAEPLQADVCDDDDLGAVLDRSTAMGGPHVLVNNAGGWGGAGRRFPDATPAEWNAVLDLNLRAPMVATQRSIGPMRRAGGGAVVNIASTAALELTPYGSPEYAAAKAGLVRFSAAVGHLRDSAGVRVNCIVPGWIGLPRAHAELAAMGARDRAAAPAMVPPRAVAATVVELVRDDQMTGRVVVLDGRRPPRVLDRAATAWQ